MVPQASLALSTLIKPNSCIIDGLELLAFQNEDELFYYTLWEDAYRANKDDLHTHNPVSGTKLKTYGGKRKAVQPCNRTQTNESMATESSPALQNRQIPNQQHQRQSICQENTLAFQNRQSPNQQLAYENGLECITETIWPNSKKLPSLSVRSRFHRYREDHKKSWEFIHKRRLADYITNSLNRLTVISTEQISYALKAVRTRKTPPSVAPNNTNNHMNTSTSETSTIRIILVPNSISNVSSQPSSSTPITSSPKSLGKDTQSFLVLNEDGVHSLLTKAKNENLKPMSRIEPSVFKRLKLMPAPYSAYQTTSFDEEVLTKKRKYYNNVKAISARPKKTTVISTSLDLSVSKKLKKDDSDDDGEDDDEIEMLERDIREMLSTKSKN